MDLVKKTLSINLTEAAERVNALTGNMPPVHEAAAIHAEAEDCGAARAAAAMLAQEMFSSARETSDNAYLSRKGWPEHPCLTLAKPHKVALMTFRHGDIVVPLHDMTGALINVQLINAEGTKRTLKG